MGAYAAASGWRAECLFSRNLFQVCKSSGAVHAAAWDWRSCDVLVVSALERAARPDVGGGTKFLGQAYLSHWSADF